MKIHPTTIRDLCLVEPIVHADGRGWLMESYKAQAWRDAGYAYSFVQDNHTYSELAGTLRGLHIQVDPAAQTKLVRCSRGRILDVAVDLRRGSATYRQHVAVELSAQNNKQLLIPRGFAHGFLTLCDDVEVQYKVDAPYDPACDRSIRYDDPDLAIAWPCSCPILSEKDRQAPFLDTSANCFSVRALVTGAAGLLGRTVLQTLQAAGIEAIGTSRATLDITDAAAVDVCIRQLQPDVIIHCAAYTAVDQAEEQPELCRTVNVTGTRHLARAAAACGTRLVFISSDYVFAGDGDQPFAEDAVTRPLNVYGASKAAGEDAVRELLAEHYIVRTAWLYGTGSDHFVSRILQRAENSTELSVVADQIGSPTYACDLARQICRLIETDHYGTYHITNSGWCSRADFARAILQLSGRAATVRPVPSSAFPTRAVRPHNTRLAESRLAKAGLACLPSWQDALKRYLGQTPS